MLDKTEKVTHFRHFFKKKALHNCIICAVQLWLREPSSYLMYNYTLHKKDSIKNRQHNPGNLLLYCRFFVICIGSSFLHHLKLSQDTYPVTYFPTGVLPQFAAVVVMR